MFSLLPNSTTNRNDYIVTNIIHRSTVNTPKNLINPDAMVFYFFHFGYEKFSKVCSIDVAYGVNTKLQ